MSAIRDRSVVRSSVIPSAKYCWSGSLLRLANGSTTIDKRGAARGWAMDVVAAAAMIAEGVEVILGAGQNHQPITAMASTAATAAATGRTTLRRRRAEMGTSRIGAASGIGSSAI